MAHYSKELASSDKGHVIMEVTRWLTALQVLKVTTSLSVIYLCDAIYIAGLHD